LFLKAICKPLLLKSPLLHASVLSPQHWPFSLEWLPQSAYLVGGCVRDALLGYISPYLDLDFVLPEDPVQTAQAIARHYRAGFVVLDETRQIARVVFEGATADFALQVGATLKEDLRRRDFTVNAIAYSPHTQTFVDPLNGQQDLDHRVLRMISAQNLREDPLRLMRAFRQAAQLNFAVESETRAQLHVLAPLLSRVAAERIRVELSYLLSHTAGTPWLKALWQDELLKSSFPQASASGVLLIEKMDEAESEVTTRWPQMEVLLHRTLSDRPKSGEGIRRTVFATAKLVGLLSSDQAAAKQTLQAMKYSRAEISFVLTVLGGLAQLRQDLSQGQLSKRQQYYLFRRMREAFPAVLVVAIAAGLALASIAPLIDEYLNPFSPIAHPNPLLTGQDLMSALNLSSGPMVGKLLSALELAQAEGQIATVKDALQLARQLCSSKF
jgi:tRNA nucleotidyltransferase (CCA-adding enzyme)